MCQRSGWLMKRSVPANTGWLAQCCPKTHHTSSSLCSHGTGKGRVMPRDAWCCKLATGDVTKVHEAKICNIKIIRNALGSLKNVHDFSCCLISQIWHSEWSFLFCIVWSEHKALASFSFWMITLPVSPAELNCVCRCRSQQNGFGQKGNWECPSCKSVWQLFGLSIKKENEHWQKLTRQRLVLNCKTTLLSYLRKKLAL